MRLKVPKGYTRIDQPRAVIVARDDVADGVLAAYRAAPPRAPTLHGFASQDPAARRYEGREPAFAITLPSTNQAVVVRHNRHGGALRSLTGDVFSGATRAPAELDISLALRARGVATPGIVAYAVYPAGLGLARADVISEEIADSMDFGALLLSTQPETGRRHGAWNAVRRLLAALATAGVRHHDLNVKNILLRRTADDDFAGYVLDVDRVELDCATGDADAGNQARLRRSVEKWRRTKGADVTPDELDALRRTATSTS